MVVPTIMPANSVSGYDIDNSLRLNDDDTPRFDKTLGTPTNTDKFTASFWFKKCKIAAAQTVFGYDSGGTAQSYITFTSDDKLEYYNRLGSGNVTQFTTNRLFRDVSAWYHIVVAVDSTDGTAGNRCKIYVNGVRETSFATSNFADQNQNQNLNSALAIRLFAWSSGEQVDGYISELYFIDGAAKAPTDFGKTNNNGVWIPIDYSGTCGDNGYRFEFKQTGTDADASGIGADTSGETNHWAVTNLAAIDVTTDTPTNNFATMNPLLGKAASFTFSEGNTRIDGNNGGVAITTSTIAPNNGKWYAEVKMISNNNQKWRAGVRRVTLSENTGNEGIVVDRAGYIYSFGTEGNSTLTDFTSSPGAITQNQIIGIAMDLDSGTKTVSFFEDGTALGSANTLDIDEEYVFFCHDYSTSGEDTPVYSWNFGQPNFSISSGNADANGHGNFEFAPPSGYFALCTKNLAENG